MAKGSARGPGKKTHATAQGEDMTILENQTMDDQLTQQEVHIPMDRDSSMDMLSYAEQPSTTMYDRGSKNCVRNYNIKKLHTRSIRPFFSDSTE